RGRGSRWAPTTAPATPKGGARWKRSTTRAGPADRRLELHRHRHRIAGRILDHHPASIISHICGQLPTRHHRLLQANGILVEGFSRLSTGSILDNADVRAIADWYGKSVATVRRCPPEIRLMPTPQPMPGRRTASPTGQIAAGSRSSGDRSEYQP